MVPPSPASTVHTPAPQPSLPHHFVESGPHPSTPPPPCQEQHRPLSQAPAPSDVPLNAPTAPSSGTAPVTQAAAPEPLSPPPASPRPCRDRRPPKRFEPETGLWVLR